MLLTPETPNLPPLPAFRGEEAADLALAVFTHSSLVPPGDPLKPGFGNTERLITLGSNALRFSVAQYFFRFDPPLSGEEITTRVTDVVDGPKVIEWLDAYKLKARLPCLPGHSGILESPFEMTKYFYAVAGAINYNLGTAALDHWVFALLNLSEEAKVEDVEMSLDPPPPDYTVPNLPPPPPHPPAHQAVGGSAGPPANIMDMITLSAVHEAAIKNRVKIEYSSVMAGLAHTPTWTVRCLIDGVERGSGTSTKSKVAKEEAARRAYVAMGWL